MNISNNLSKIKLRYCTGSAWLDFGQNRARLGWFKTKIIRLFIELSFLFEWSDQARALLGLSLTWQINNFKRRKKYAKMKMKKMGEKITKKNEGKKTQRWREKREREWEKIKKKNWREIFLIFYIYYFNFIKTIYHPIFFLP